MRMLQIGNRIVNLETITSATLDNEASVPGSATWKECVVSFTNGDCLVFYGDEADIVWSFIKPFATAFVTQREKVA